MTAPATEVARKEKSGLYDALIFDIGSVLCLNSIISRHLVLAGFTFVIFVVGR